MKSPIVKMALGTCIGLIAFLVVLILIQLISSQVYKIPTNLDPLNMEQMKQYTMTMPLGAYLFLIFGYIVAPFIGGFVAVRIAKTNLLPAIIIGVSALVAGVLNFKSFPSPTWVVIASLVSMLLFAWLGGRYALHNWVFPQREKMI